jgi:hypothetical protein
METNYQFTSLLFPVMAEMFIATAAPFFLEKSQSRKAVY